MNSTIADAGFPAIAKMEITGKLKYKSSDRKNKMPDSRKGEYGPFTVVFFTD